LIWERKTKGRGHNVLTLCKNSLFYIQFLRLKEGEVPSPCIDGVCPYELLFFVLRKPKSSLFYYSEIRGRIGFYDPERDIHAVHNLKSKKTMYAFVFGWRKPTKK